MTTRSGTLIFCTAHVDDESVWDGRYRRWFDALSMSDLDCGTALMVDDGSATMPDWTDVAVIREGECLVTDASRVLFQFKHNLGRRSVFDFPGWYRSFTFACEYADRNGFTKVVHIESDAFVISERLRDYINAVHDEWLTLWCTLHNFPEITIQIMAGSGLTAYRTFCEQVPHEALVGRPYEAQLPFTKIEKGFIGDRYGERLPYVPVEADFVSQALEADSSYYWWMKPAAHGPKPIESKVSDAERLRRLGRDNDLLRYDRGRLQTMIYGLQNEVATLRHVNQNLCTQLTARPVRRLCGFANRLRALIRG